MPVIPFQRELGPGGPTGLRSILHSYFLPELRRMQGLRGPVESAFFNQITQPGALNAAASEAASGTARQLFAPGGEVSSLIRQARGQSVSRGFDPASAEGAERGVIDSALRRVSDTFATQAAGLEGSRISALAGAYGQQNESINSLMESLFTGAGSAEQLDLARRASRRRFLGLF